MFILTNSITKRRTPESLSKHECTLYYVIAGIPVVFLKTMLKLTRFKFDMQVLKQEMLTIA